MDVLFVDGYNIIGDWPELKALKEADLAGARERLIEKMAEYQAYAGMKVILVFDAYATAAAETTGEQFRVEMVFTKAKETADEWIERAAGRWQQVGRKVYVATSDQTEQWEVFGRGALRKSARELAIEMEGIEAMIARKLKMNQDKKQARQGPPISADIRDVFERWRRGDH